MEERFLNCENCRRLDGEVERLGRELRGEELWAGAAEARVAELEAEVARLRDANAEEYARGYLDEGRNWKRALDKANARAEAAEKEAARQKRHNALLTVSIRQAHERRKQLQAIAERLEARVRELEAKLHAREVDVDALNRTACEYDEGWRKAEARVRELEGEGDWRKVSDDTAFARPFGTVRQCDCGALVGGGPARCVRCVKALDHQARAERLERAVREAPHGVYCVAWKRLLSEWPKGDGPCDCWKAKALEEGRNG